MNESYDCSANSDHSTLCIHHINKHTLGHADEKYSLLNRRCCVCVCQCAPQAGVWLSLQCATVNTENIDCNSSYRTSKENERRYSILNLLSVWSVSVQSFFFPPSLFHWQKHSSISMVVSSFLPFRILSLSLSLSLSALERNALTHSHICTNTHTHSLAHTLIWLSLVKEG